MNTKATTQKGQLLINVHCCTQDITYLLFQGMPLVIDPNGSSSESASEADVPKSKGRCIL